MRVLHCINGLGVGGAEFSLLRLIEVTRGRMAHEVLSLSSSTPLRDRFEAAGAEVRILRHEKWPTIRHAAAHADVVQGWMAHGNAAATFVRNLATGRPSVLAWNLRMPLDTAASEKRATLLLTRSLAVVSGGVDLLIANSPTTLRQHQEAGYKPKASTVIGNGFDTEIYRPDALRRAEVRAELGAEPTDFVVGMVGRVHPAKGHDLLLEAAESVASRIPRIRFWLAGRGAEETSALADAARARGLGRVVQFLGVRSDVPRLLAGLDALCAPSAYESFPNAVAEGMASGLVCISSPLDDIEQLLGDGRGVVLERRSVQCLADALLMVARMSPEERIEIGNRARRRIASTFSLKSAADAYEACYRDAIFRTAVH